MDPDDTDDHRERGDDGEYRAHDVEDIFEGDERTTADEVDQRIVDLLSWILDTETRAKIYIHLLANPGSTSEEVAKGTGLYPSTVREALAELHEEDRVTREKRASEGAGNNPYEYTAIQPSELVGGVADQVQQELNTIFTLDRVLERRSEPDPAFDDDVEPVTITVDDVSPLEDESSDADTDEPTDDEDDTNADGDDPV
ncbi:helix-turn-helix domain-containing protein [Natrialba sp. INN-245]|uniref:helix-turn-helix domain-containing protein n=1 Tax=Natrialba sp. INN-245 TaxID=2690967 RepID=UPI001312F0BD|nr:helix-turn-helix domain-containing protein [Natrialba sp. INN-245]MWV39446.1 winged helix-turn-helix transcriptional regulator [Natrialba sp. INN-245]